MNLFEQDKTMESKKSLRYIIYILMLIMVIPYTADAQRMQHRSTRSNQRISKPQTQNRSLNGGAQKSRDRDLSKRNVQRKPNPEINRNINKTDITRSRETTNRNKTNVNRSNKNVNINVDKSRNVNIRNNRNTVVRSNTRVYTRPPYSYGRYRYYSYHPFHYHPYRPFYWGPAWHPWGFFVTALAVTAIVVTIENQRYHYDKGVYYVESNGGYTVVQAPPGATIKVLPEGSQKVVVNETTNNYYYGGTFYEKTDQGYRVVPPTAGTVVQNLPEGGEEVKVGDITFVKVGETYYQPIQQDGKNMYEVVNVEENKD